MVEACFAGDTGEIKGSYNSETWFYAPVSCCSRFSRWETLADRNPTNWKVSVGSPEATKDANTADGPAQHQRSFHATTEPTES